MELRPDDISEILRLFAESDLEELHLDVGGTRLDLSKSGSLGRAATSPTGPASATNPAGAEPERADVAPVAQPAVSAPGAPPTTAPPPTTAVASSEEPAGAPAESAARDGLVELRSPLLGVFYRRPAPDKPPFVDVGSVVEPDDPVCIVDVMKMFTRVPAGTGGTVVEILAQDGVLVEHGEVLMTIRPR